MARKLELDLSWLRNWQKDFFQNHKLRNVLVVHRRWGKTIVAVTFLVYKALLNRGAYGYVAPYRSQAKQIAWEALSKICKNIPWVVFNISELKATLPNWSVITLFGADNQEALRWLDLRWIVLDEYKDISATLFSEIVAPMINAYKDGWVVYIGTPWWKNQFYDVYIKATERSEDYYVSYLNIYDTELLDWEQLERAKEDGTDEHWDDSAFRQEYLLDWGVATKYAYYWKVISQMYKDWRFKDNIYDPSLTVYTAWDIGMNDYTCIVFFQYWKWTIRIIDYYENRGFAFDHYYEVLKAKPYKYKMHFLPHDITVKEWSWNTRLETFNNLFGWETSHVLKRYGVEDWINAVRELFPSFVFDTSLVSYINKLSEYQPKLDKDKVPTNNPEHSDVADTIRYLASAHNQYIETLEEFDTFTVDYWNII